ncbi:MAG TPA: hypothetical protein DEP53_05265 [Bacteroidetes bacterium]|nr:hypothetical protein [Bacteroidota bacterium]
MGKALFYQDNIFMEDVNTRFSVEGNFFVNTVRQKPGGKFLEAELQVILERQAPKRTKKPKN